jgi:glucosyl-dolichyl phosphate glucuronosyltransferase
MDCSVVICTRNRYRQLETALSSIAASIIPPSLTWELIVVDNGSTDATPTTIEAFKVVLPVRRIFEPLAGLSNARNAGVAGAKGDYIVWTDDDVIVAPNWLAAFASAFRRYPDAAVFTGKVTPILLQPTPPWFASAVDTLADLLAKRDLGPEPLPLGVDAPFVGACFAVRALEQKQYSYNPDLGVAPGRRMGGEEIDVLNRIIASGKDAWWIPDAEVRHIIPASRQTFSYVLEYYESEGARSAYLILNSGNTRRIFKAFLSAGVKLPINFVQFQVARALHLENWVRYLIYYANKRGMLKFALTQILNATRRTVTQ